MSSVPPVPPQPPVSGAMTDAYGRPYGYGYGYAMPRPTNALAIIALVLSLTGMSIGAVITGHIALAQIRRTADQGHGMALAGLIIGYVGCAFWVLGVAFAFIFPLIMWATIGATSSGVGA